MFKFLLLFVLNFLMINGIAQEVSLQSAENDPYLSKEQVEKIDDQKSYLIRKNYEPGTQSWTDYIKLECTYDETGNKMLTHEYVWNSNQKDWLARMKYEPLYDDEAKLKQLTSYRYHTKYQQWIDEDVQVFSYNKNNLVSEIIQYRYHNSKKNKANKKEFYYVGLVEEIIEYVWDAHLNKWRTQSKTKKVFDKEGKLEEIKLSAWDVRLGRWINYKKSVQAYSDDGNLLLQEDFAWKMSDSNNIKGRWVYSEKQENEYEMNRVYLTTYYTWNKKKQDWVERQKKEFRQFDSKNRAKVQTTYTKNYNTKTWISGFQHNYHYANPVQSLELVSNDVNTKMIDKQDKQVSKTQFFDVKQKLLYKQTQSDRQLEDEMYLYPLLLE